MRFYAIPQILGILQLSPRGCAMRTKKRADAHADAVSEGNAMTWATAHASRLTSGVWRQATEHKSNAEQHSTTGQRISAARHTSNPLPLTIGLLPLAVTAPLQ